MSVIATESGAPEPLFPAGHAARRLWPLAIGLAALCVATFVNLGRESWSTEAGAHGPIVLATGAWLIWHIRADLIADAKPAGLGWMIGGIAVAAPLYVIGRAFDLLVLEVGALYLFFVIAALRVIGFRGIGRNLFPFLYPGLLIPPPGWVLDAITSPLRSGISAASTSLLAMLDYPVARDGVVISIAQYQLLVEDACSGMNSLIGLSAISLFYIYMLHRAEWRHALILIALVLPIAIFANFLRVVVLILVTYYFGNAIGQGVFHEMAGIFLFAVALSLVVAADWGVRKLLPAKRGATA